MVIALVFAAGIGERMNSRAKPKQFLKIHGKPILIYTIEHFENHPDVDKIVIVCLQDWIKQLKNMLEKNNIKKVTNIVSGGATGHESIYNGLKEIKSFCKDDDIVIIHDGVRPLISGDLITENIETAKKFGNAITVSPATESIGSNSENKIDKITARNKMLLIKAPQTFYFKDIWNAHQKALEENFMAVDSASLCHRYGAELNTVVGNTYNIKITSPSDYYIFKAIYDAQENLQIFGLW